MIKIICLGKLKEPYLIDAISDYYKRLRKYHKICICQLKDNDNILVEENEILSELQKDKSYKVLLDMNGNELSSINFSQFINDKLTYYSNITFIIGGSLGLSNKLLSICDYKICFSKMTFPHQLIRVFLLEQIYRGFKIINNETYHK